MNYSFETELAISLAERLCFRVRAFCKWVSDKQISTETLIRWNREVHQEGVSNELSSKILIAFVNRLPANKCIF